jgi:hypothetical protein
MEWCRVVNNCRRRQPDDGVEEGIMGEIKQVSNDSGYQATLELDRQVTHPIAHDRRFVIDCPIISAVKISQ